VAGQQNMFCIDLFWMTIGYFASRHCWFSSSDVAAGLRLWPKPSLRPDNWFFRALFLFWFVVAKIEIWIELEAWK